MENTQRLKAQLQQLFDLRAQIAEVMMKGFRYGKILTIDDKKFSDLIKLKEKLERDLSIEVYELKLQNILKTANRDLIH